MIRILTDQLLPDEAPFSLGSGAGGSGGEAALPDSVVSPPAGRGDAVRAVLAGATAIVVLDGPVAGGVLPIELLWALSRGVAVFGGAGIGALRAAELAPFGAVGAGAIYAAYANGTETRDDQVERGWDLEHQLEDTRCVLEAVRRWIDAGRPAPSGDWAFPETRAWRALLAEVTEQADQRRTHSGTEQADQKPVTDRSRS